MDPRGRLRHLLKRAHDRVFADFVYQVARGPMQGYRRRGRMPWLQPAPSEALAREVAFLEGLGLEGAVVYDVGANIGTHTVLFHRLAGPAGAVHAFEPDPHFRRELLDLVILNRLGTVEVHGVALGAAPGSAELVVPDGRRVRASATLSPEVVAAIGDAEVRRARVRVARLDGVVQSLALPRPDFVKIDVEGLEVDVIDGARETLVAARPRIFVEVHGASPDAQRARAHTLGRRLQALGYRSFSHVERATRIDLDDPPAGGHWLVEA